MSDDRALKLLEAFSGVEEELLERCERAVTSEVAGAQEDVIKTGSQGKMVSLAEKLKKNFRKSSWQYGSAVAAVLCIAIVGLTSLGGLRVGRNDSAAYEAVVEDAVGKTSAFPDSATTGGAVTETPSTATTYHTTAESDYTTDAASGSGDNGLGQNILDNLESFIGKITESEEMNQENRTNSIKSNEEKTAATESVETSKLSPEFGVTEDGIAGGSKEYNYVVVTEAEARAHAMFGPYIPTELPEGYVLEGVYASGEGESAALMLSWSKGMDSIMVNITLPAEAPETIDITKTETYDEYLYEIPHAETVPEDYREVFNHPVCAWEDFALEFVQKRMISRGGDMGDTDTPRGNFSVLYPDGVLVYFNGRGTAEEIWALFASMKANN